MAKPKLKPKGFLRSKIVDPDISREISALMQAVATIAADNKTPFFPAYTDHGIDHLQAVLDWCVTLTPKGARRVLEEHDAAVIIGGALLHDVAMHLHVPGFIELVGGDWPSPLPWFDTPQGRRPADRPWDELWNAFKDEARHFDHTDVIRILGPANNSGTPDVVYADHVDAQALGISDRMYIGEFLRRHHARLAHEIAVFGFPGLGEVFPRPARGLAKTLRELMGLVARSHNEDLRVLVAHLDEHRHRRDPRGVRVPYAAALLRVADFAQLDFRRAPSLLLRMAAPQSQVSIDAWTQHKAVEQVDLDDGTDPGAIRVDVSSDIELAIFLQLEQLFAGLQHELDQCAAVLAEVYGRSPLAALARRRVNTNMSAPEFRRALPFVPRDSRLRSAEDMFRLVVHDLYGDRPWVAGRELAQNALDAVRERSRLEAALVQSRGSDGRPPHPRGRPPVRIEICIAADGTMVLRVTDEGVGMTSDTVVDYFLKAGASLAPTSLELAHLDRSDVARHVKAGRFGVGVLAAFLLGDEVVVRTRHMGEAKGIEFRARFDSELVPITKGIVMPIGTTVEVEISTAARRHLAGEREIGSQVGLVRLGARAASMPSDAVSLARRIADAWAAEWPAAQIVIRSEQPRVDGGSVVVRIPRAAPSESWIEFAAPGFERAMWQFEGSAVLIHNGMKVVDPEGGYGVPNYEWRDRRAAESLRRASVAVVDRRQALKFTMNRFRLRSPELPFEHELIRSIALDLTARCLLAHPYRRPLYMQGEWGGVVSTSLGWYPALPHLGASCGWRSMCAVLNLARKPTGELEVPSLGNIRFGAPVAKDEVVWPRWGSGWAVSTELSADAAAAWAVRKLASDIRFSGFDPTEIVVASDVVKVSGVVDLLDNAPGLRAASMLDMALETASDDPILGPAVRRGTEVTILVRGVPSPAVTPSSYGTLTRTWVEILGEPLPYDDAKRAELAERVYGDHPEIRPHMDRQRRIAAADHAKERGSR